jgi:putative transcriptional regulator
VGPGFRLAPIPEAQREGWRAYVLRIPAGQSVPHHGHSGPELICLLEGSFVEQGSYTAGHFLEIAPDVEHSLTSGNDGCACLVATKGPLVLRGSAKLLQAALPI